MKTKKKKKKKKKRLLSFLHRVCAGHHTCDVQTSALVTTCQVPGALVSVLGLDELVSEYCDLVTEHI